MTFLAEKKLNVFAPDADCNELTGYLDAFAATACGSKEGGSIAKEDAPSRFRWLTAVRSSSLQTSRPHPGFCADQYFKYPPGNDRIFIY